MNKLLWIIPILMLTGCPMTPQVAPDTPRFEDDARAACEGKEVGDVCRDAVCNDWGYVPRGVCMKTVIGTACMNYGHEPPMRVYCAPDETCTMEARGQAVFRKPRE